MNFDIITVGSATQDVFLMSKGMKRVRSKAFEGGVGECFALGAKIEVDDVVFDTGGGATNAAATFGNLGFRTSALCQIGEDGAGHEVRRSLKAHHVSDTLLVESKREHTAYSAILLMPNGERTVFVFRGASRAFAPAHISWKKLQSKWLYCAAVGGNLPLLKRLFAHARSNTIQIAWNPGKQELQRGVKALSKFISQTTVFNVNKEEAELLLGKTGSPDVLLKNLCQWTKSGIAVITDGMNGSFVCASDGSRLHVAASRHKAVNRTGAGDAFGSGLVAGLMNNMSLEDAVRIGVLNAGSVVTKMGAKNGLLTRWPSTRQLQTIHIRHL